MPKQLETLAGITQGLNEEILELTSRIETLTKAQQEHQLLTWKLLEKKVVQLNAEQQVINT